MDTTEKSRKSVQVRRATSLYSQTVDFRDESHDGDMIGRCLVQRLFFAAIWRPCLTGGQTAMKPLFSIAAFGSMLLAATAFLCKPSGAAVSKATAMEIAQLPKFCYEQYVDGVSGPEYSIGRSCGPGMNHYCGALVSVIRAKRISGNSKERLKQLSMAKTNVVYTLKWMESYPACQIRDHVKATLTEIELQMKIYGTK